MRLLHAWKQDVATFDDENLVSSAGLVPVLALSEQTHLPEVIGERVRFDSERIVSAAANPVGKTLSIIAGADSIDDMAILPHGGMGRAFDCVYAPSTLGSFLREFTYGTQTAIA